MKAASILLMVRTNLALLPAAEQDVLRRFFTQYVTGSDAQHHRRWIRLVRDLWNARCGTGFQLYRAQERSGQFHAYHRAILAAIFERQERYPLEDALHDALKLRCWFVEWVDGSPRPRSTEYDSCSEDEIREFNRRLQFVLHDPDLQAHLWPHLSEQLRLENVTAILTHPKDRRDQ